MIKIGTKVRVGNEIMTFRGYWSENIAMCMNNNETRLYYIPIGRLTIV